MIGAIVLAAGSSSRMGRAKATLTVGPSGPTFLEAIVATLDSAHVSAWRVVVPPNDGPVPRNGVVNPNPLDGMLSSVQCGLRAFDDGLDAVFLWPVDHPLVTRDTIVWMMDALHSTKAPVVVPTYGGRRGHPVLFSAEVFPELHAADPAKGARAVVHGHDDRLEIAVHDRGAVTDIDTPDDYVRVFGTPPRQAAPRT
jgi:molybdenum cofactor cytidylyltransferase